MDKQEEPCRIKSPEQWVPSKEEPPFSSRYGYIDYISHMHGYDSRQIHYVIDDDQWTKRWLCDTSDRTLGHRHHIQTKWRYLGFGPYKEGDICLFCEAILYEHSLSEVLYIYQKYHTRQRKNDGGNPNWLEIQHKYVGKWKYAWKESGRSSPICIPDQPTPKELLASAGPCSYIKLIERGNAYYIRVSDFPNLDTLESLYLNSIERKKWSPFDSFCTTIYILDLYNLTSDIFPISGNEAMQIYFCLCINGTVSVLNTIIKGYVRILEKPDEMYLQELKKYWRSKKLVIPEIVLDSSRYGSSGFDLTVKDYTPGFRLRRLFAREIPSDCDSGIVLWTGKNSSIFK